MFWVVAWLFSRDEMNLIIIDKKCRLILHDAIKVSISEQEIKQSTILRVGVS
jgi:hypothetical protein